MPMPWTYRHSEKKFKAFLADARDRMGLVSDNATYTAAEGVLHAFRARRTPQQVVDFAQVLSCTLRALPIQNWHMPEAPAPWPDRATPIREVKANRQHHNIAPDSAIEATAHALRRITRQRNLDRVLASIWSEAEAFWAVTVDNPRELEQRIL